MRVLSQGTEVYLALWEEELIYYGIMGRVDDAHVIFYGIWNITEDVFPIRMKHIE